MRETFLTVYMILDLIAKVMMTCAIFSLFAIAPLFLIYQLFQNSVVVAISFIPLSFLGIAVGYGYFNSTVPFTKELV